MSKKLSCGILIIYFSVFSLFAQDSAETPLSVENKALFETYILRFYSQQNMNGKSGHLMEDLIFEQSIKTSDLKGTKTINVLLFCKGPKVCLVYSTDNNGKPTAYLQRNNETWIYRENLRLPMKISLSQNVSGEANLGDVLGINLIDDFFVSDIEKNPDTITFTFNRKSVEFPYSSVKVNANPVTKDLYSIQYLSMGGTTIRQADLENYSIVSGDHRLPIWSITNLHMNTDRVTRIIYLDVKRMTIPDSFFHPNAIALSQFLVWVRSFK